MFHVGAIFALWSRSSASAVGPTRTLSSRALNLVDGVKLGGIQSFAPRVAVSQIADFLVGTIEANLPFRIPFARLVSTAMAIVAASAFRKAAIFATLTEDYAYRNNRVVASSAAPSGFVIEYRFKQELVRRTRRLRARVRQVLRHQRLLFLTGTDNLNFGHPSGTVRFGTSPENSVLTPGNQLRGLDNLYVTDASFFPSSAATNPGLTVAANALRVAEIIFDRLPEGQGQDLSLDDVVSDGDRIG
jgi:choline dehydrogenase-like flavoprotein